MGWRVLIPKVRLVLLVDMHLPVTITALPPDSRRSRHLSASRYKLLCKLMADGFPGHNLTQWPIE